MNDNTATGRNTEDKGWNRMERQRKGKTPNTTTERGKEGGLTRRRRRGNEHKRTRHMKQRK